MSIRSFTSVGILTVTKGNARSSKKNGKLFGTGNSKKRMDAILALGSQQ